MKNMKGTISISRWSSSHESGISITVQDDISGTSFIEINLTPENFGLALVGRSNVPCEFDLGTRFVGKRHEHKTEIIPVEKPHSQLTDEEIDAVLAPYEVDGWRGNERDLNNYHRIKTTGTEVSFWRYVDPETNVPLEWSRR